MVVGAQSCVLAPPSAHDLAVEIADLRVGDQVASVTASRSESIGFLANLRLFHVKFLN